MEQYHKGNALFVDEFYEEAVEVDDTDERSLIARIQYQLSYLVYQIAIFLFHLSLVSPF
jgi:hypothetical protein